MNRLPIRRETTVIQPPRFVLPFVFRAFLLDLNSLFVQAKRRADRERIPCRIARAHQVFPYTLMADYPGNSRQPSWHMTMIRDPVDRVSLGALVLCLAYSGV